MGGRKGIGELFGFLAVIICAIILFKVFAWIHDTLF
jgi:hypothetical protein